MTHVRDSRPLVVRPAWLLGALHSLLRTVTGLLFMQHGLQKLFGLLAPLPLPGMPPMRAMGAPPPFSLFWVAGVLETFGGFLIAVGLLTRPVAFLLAGERPAQLDELAAVLRAIPHAAERQFSRSFARRAT